MSFERKWRVALVLLFGVTITIAGLLSWAYLEFAQSLPITSGVTTVDGLKADVDIIRDDYGIPHIYAHNERDLYLAWGYAVSQDRYWQMKFF